MTRYRIVLMIVDPIGRKVHVINCTLRVHTICFALNIFTGIITSFEKQQLLGVRNMISRIDKKYRA